MEIMKNLKIWKLDKKK